MDWGCGTVFERSVSRLLFLILELPFLRLADRFQQVRVRSGMI